MTAPATSTPTETASTANESTFVISLPGSISSGDRLICVLGTDGNPGISNWDGFTQRKAITTTVSDPTLYIAEKIATGSEGSTISVVPGSSEHFAALVFKCTGAHASQAIEVSTGTEGNDAAPDPDSLTVSWGDEDTLFIAAEAQNNASVVSAYPSGWSYATGDATGTGAGTVGSGAACLQTTADGTENPPAFTTDRTQPWVAVTIGLRAAAAAGGEEFVGFGIPIF